MPALAWQCGGTPTFSHTHEQLLPIFTGDLLFTTLIVSAVCFTLEKLARTDTVANSGEASGDTDDFLQERLGFVLICSLESAVF